MRPLATSSTLPQLRLLSRLRPERPLKPHPSPPPHGFPREQPVTLRFARLARWIWVVHNRRSQELRRPGRSPGLLPLHRRKARRMGLLGYLTRPVCPPSLRILLTGPSKSLLVLFRKALTLMSEAGDSYHNSPLLPPSLLSTLSIPRTPSPPCPLTIKRHFSRRPHPPTPIRISSSTHHILPTPFDEIARRRTLRRRPRPEPRPHQSQVPLPPPFQPHPVA